jgi:hypothetical protein
LETPGRTLTARHLRLGENERSTAMVPVPAVEKKPLLRLQCLRHSFGLTAHVAGGGPMLDFDYKDLFQWDRFITPSIIKLFYWLALGISALFALANIVSGLALMSLHPLASLFWILGSLIGLVVGVIFSRVISEYFLIMFRINEHLGAIRNQGSGIREQEAGPRL